MTKSPDDKVVRPARFRISRASDLRRYFAQDVLMVRCRGDIQGAVARSVDEVGAAKTREILQGAMSYLDMMEAPISDGPRESLDD